ncbi:hypothetical protein BDFB_006814 [Asbolus verrucosus]|uniref:7tm 6 domain containing protein n=1 Tax=Asbolus verrucosus TaxID=1661398 RepID=A0A482VB13_ASBVE|nr:hypothetical protein BDFB_006814 [Asbolus verrucosus]
MKYEEQEVKQTVEKLIQTYMFLKKFEGVYFIKYAPLYVGMCYILLCIATIPHSTRVVVDAFKNIPMWRWDCAGNKIEKKIKNEAKIMNTFFIVYAILVTLSAILHVIPDSDDKYMIYPFALFAEFPEWENILGWCFRSTFPVLGLLMITPYSQVIYFCNHIKFQMYLFIYYIKKMDTCFESVDKEKLFYNENYQKEIEKLSEHTSEIFESLKELRWYHWNKKIKKLYLIFLLNVEKPFRIQFSEDMSINYDLGTSVGKAVYSMLSVLSQIQDSFQSN